MFVDGSREQVDLVLTATGYHHDCPFLEPDVLAHKDGRPDLYLGMFSRTHPTFAVLGFIEFASAAYSNFDAMAELIVADATAGRGSPRSRQLAARKASHRPDLTGGVPFIRSERHANYVEVHTYLKVLAEVTRETLAASPAADAHARAVTGAA